MKAQIVITQVKLAISHPEYQQLCERVAQDVATVGGLVWKAWIFNEGRNEAGGIYLFQDEDSVNAFLGGPIIASMENHPAFADVRIKTFDVLDAPSAVTHFYSATEGVPAHGKLAPA